MELGTAVVDITPPVGAHLAGWAGERFSEVIHQPLTCRVLYLTQGDEVAVIASLDLLGMSADMAREIRASAEASVGIPAANIMIASTHTHSGPLLPPWRTDQADPDARYLEELERKVVGAIRAAVHETEPVTVGFGRGRGELAISRRLPWKDGRVDFPPHADPAGVVDQELGLIRFDAVRGGVRAVLFSYGCHPTVGGPTAWIGPDYPGEARRMIERQFPGALAVFLLGNCGDVRANYTNPDGTFLWDSSRALVEQAGTRVGAEAIKAAVQVQPDDDARLATGRAFSDIFGRDGAIAQRCEFQAIRVGPAAIVSNPGECFAGIGLDVRRRADLPLLFSSITNGLLGYVPTAEAYPYGGYEVETSYASFGLASPIREDGEDVFREGMLAALRASAGEGAGGGS